MSPEQKEQQKGVHTVENFPDRKLYPEDFAIADLEKDKYGPTTVRELAISRTIQHFRDHPQAQSFADRFLDPNFEMSKEIPAQSTGSYDFIANRYRLLVVNGAINEEKELFEIFEQGTRSLFNYFSEHDISTEVDGVASFDFDSIDDMQTIEALVDQAGAFEAIMLTNLRLVRSFARNYQRNTNTPVRTEDLIDFGHFGLIRAIYKFDIERGYKFSTLATWWINQSIKRGDADEKRNIRFPVHIEEKATEIRKGRREFWTLFGRDPTTEELAEATGFEQEEIDRIKRLENGTVSLNRQLGDDKKDGERIDMVPEEGSEFEQAIESVLLADLASDIAVNAGLTERELLVVSMRYGIDFPGVERPDEQSNTAPTNGNAATQHKSYTQKGTARILRLKRGTVSQYERSAKTKIRDYLISQGMYAEA